MITYSIGSGQECSGPLNITLEGSPTGLPLSINPRVGHVFCNDADEGSISLEISGGTPNYTCIWSTGETNESLYNLPTGNYTVTVTDHTNCTEVSSINIIQQHPLNQELYLADYNCCGECHLRDGEITYLYQGSDYFMHVKDVKDNIDVGQIKGCLTQNPYPTSFQNYNLLERQWELFPINSFTKVRLFFTEYELLQLANESNYKEIDDRVFENLSVLHFTGGNNSSESFQNIKSYTHLSFEKFGDDDIWYVEFTPSEMQSERSGYALALGKVDRLEYAEENVALSEQDEEKKILHRLLKNPVVDEIELLALDPNAKYYGKISILNRNGIEIDSELFFDESIHHHKINVKEIPAGLFFVVVWVFDEDHQDVIKFIKLR